MVDQVRHDLARSSKGDCRSCQIFSSWPCSAADRNPLISIRQARPDDGSAIEDAIEASVRTLAGKPYTQPQIDAWIADEASENQVSGSGRAVIVAESIQGLIGFSRFSQLELEALYVHPTHSRRSIGELLLQNVEKSAYRQGAQTLSLDAALPAVGFYKSAGYIVVGRATPVFDNGVALECLRMQKTLAPDRFRKDALMRTRPATEISRRALIPRRFPARSRPDHLSSLAEYCTTWLD